MPTWNSRGLRGSALEEMINYTNEQYLMKKLALIQKIPTPIKPIQIEKETRHITLAYFDQKSTVDYIGAVQGIPVCFDAKESAVSAFPLQNIHEHQIQFMKNFEQQDGIAFIILYYSHLRQKLGQCEQFHFRHQVLQNLHRLHTTLFCPHNISEASGKVARIPFSQVLPL